MNPNDLIDTIVDAIDYAEIAKDSQGLIKARRLLNNELRQAIDLYIQVEITKALDGISPRQVEDTPDERRSDGWRERRYFPLQKIQPGATDGWR